MTARQKCKRLKRLVVAYEDALMDAMTMASISAEDARRRHKEAEKYRREISWYQELYDKARAGHKRAAEDAETLRRENAKLQAELAGRKPLLQRLFG